MEVKRASMQEEQSWRPVQQEEVADPEAETPHAAKPRCSRLPKRRWRLWVAAAAAGSLTSAVLALRAHRCRARGGPAAATPEGAVSLAAAGDLARRADAVTDLLQQKQPDQSRSLVLQAMEKAADRELIAKKAKAFELDRELLAKPGALTSKILDLARAPEALELAKKKSPALKQALEANRTLLEEVKKEERSSPKSTRQSEVAERKAECSINMLFVAQYLARGGVTIDAMTVSCGKATKGLADKVCILNSLLFVGTLARLGSSLALAATSCGEEVNIRASCASPSVAVVASLTQFGAGGMVAKKACAAKRKEAPTAVRATILGAAGPPGPDGNLGAAGPDSNGNASVAGARRLAEGRRLFLGAGPENLLAGCVLDATAITFAFGSIGLAISDAVLDNCPPKRTILGDLAFKLMQNACALDISVVIFQVARIATFVALSIVQCDDIGNLEAFCASAVGSIVAAVASLNLIANAWYGACDLGIKAESLRAMIPQGFGIGLGLGRRRLAGATGAVSNPAERLRLAQQFGYNASNPYVRFDSLSSAVESMRAFQELEAEDFARDKERAQQRFEEPAALMKHLSSALGIHKSDLEAEEARISPERQEEEDRQFLELMEPVLSKEDLRHIDEGALPAHTLSLFERLRSKEQCL